MTLHSLQRANERVGLDPRTAVHMIDLAEQYGRKAWELEKRERDYLLRKSRDGSQAVAYRGYCFIFSAEGVSITVYPVPEWFGKSGRRKKRTCHCDGKIHVRNPKKYFTRYAVYDEF